MKKFTLKLFKTLLPLGLGFLVAWMSFLGLSSEELQFLWQGFKELSYFYIGLSVVFNLLSNFSRAKRWQYVLENMGYTVPFWHAYHAVMISYFVNTALPRVGEASRAMVLQRTDNVPFAKGFGSIFAERAVDIVMLALIAVLTFFMQLDNANVLLENIRTNPAFNDLKSNPLAEQIKEIISYVMILAFLSVLTLFALKPLFRYKVKGMLLGFVQGIWHTLDNPKRLQYLIHTFIIWGLYVVSFWSCFQSLPSTSLVPWAGILVAFIAGSLGVAFIPGGIGAYPLLVAVSSSLYMGKTTTGIHLDALALGWMAWLAQTLSVVFFGAISYYALNRRKK